MGRSPNFRVVVVCKYCCQPCYTPTMVQSQVMLACLSEIPRRGRSQRGRCANLSQIARQICAKLLVFRFVHHTKGRAKLSQICRTFTSKFRTMLCKYPFCNAPFSKLLSLGGGLPGRGGGWVRGDIAAQVAKRRAIAV